MSPLSLPVWTLLRLLAEKESIEDINYRPIATRDAIAELRDQGFITVQDRSDGWGHQAWVLTITTPGRMMYEWQRPLVAEQHEPEVVNIYKIPKDWKENPDYVYIGRPGKGEEGYFGNPIEIAEGQESGDTLPAYEEYLRKRVAKDAKFRGRVRALTGKKLVCFCKPKPCHGDLLAKICGELNS